MEWNGTVTHHLQPLAPWLAGSLTKLSVVLGKLAMQCTHVVNPIRRNKHGVVEAGSTQQVTAHAVCV